VTAKGGTRLYRCPDDLYIRYRLNRCDPEWRLSAWNLIDGVGNGKAMSLRNIEMNGGGRPDGPIAARMSGIGDVAAGRSMDQDDEGGRVSGAHPVSSGGKTR
jgi:hypothetical protein